MKKRRGRKPAFSAADITERIRDDIIHEYGISKKEVDEVWSDASKKFGGELKKNNLY